MKSANLLVVVWICLPTGGFSQTFHSPITSYYPASGAYSNHFQDAFSMTSNVGALSFNQNVSAGVYGERRFMLAETSVYAAVISLPTKSGNFALCADYGGYRDFNESQTGIAYGLALSEKIGIAAKFNYYHLRIPSYLSASTVNVEVGTVIHISDQLHTGLSVYNPFESALGKNTGEKLASVYKVGIGYELSSSFFSQLEVIKEKSQDANVHIGLHYKPLEQILIRTGLLTGVSSGYVGVGYIHQNFRLDISVSYHQQLGISPGLLLLYQLKKSANQ